MGQWDTFKRPGESFDLGLDWSDLLADDEAIADHSFAVSPSDTSGIVLGVSYATGTCTVVWLSGGAAGQTARINATIITSGGREFVEPMELAICP